jgi:hypothetical protein
MQYTMYTLQYTYYAVYYVYYAVNIVFIKSKQLFETQSIYSKNLILSKINKGSDSFRRKLMDEMKSHPKINF